MARERNASRAVGGWPIAAATLVSVVVGLLTFPRVLAGWSLSPDVIEHLAIANNWIQGQGFVDPVKWTFYLELASPQPGFAVRAPAISVLAALPLALGGGAFHVVLAHALWASLVTGAIVLVARRFMSLPAAVAAALLFGLTPSWLGLSVRPLTEVVGVSAFLLILATARGVLRSPRLALLCSGATVLAWTARPNLMAMALAVCTAVVWEIGPRKALRHRPLWTYALGVLVLYTLTQWAVASATGLTPYAGYGNSSQMLGVADASRYQKEYPGTWAFFQQNADAIGNRIRVFVRLFIRVMCFKPTFHYVGWLLPPALLWSLRRRERGGFEYRLMALSAAGFSLVVVSYIAAFDVSRYPIFVALCTSLCALALLDDGLRAAARRWRGHLSGRVVAGLEIAAVAALVASSSLPRSARLAAEDWNSFRERGIRMAPHDADGVWRLCPAMAPEGVVAARNPWSVVLWCGNASVQLPVDLSDQSWQSRFIDEQQVRYVIGNGHPKTLWVAESERLRRIGQHEGLTLYEVREPPPRPDPWIAPAPLACAGRGTDCGPPRR